MPCLSRWPESLLCGGEAEPVFVGLYGRGVAAHMFYIQERYDCDTKLSAPARDSKSDLTAQLNKLGKNA
jgi:hypothetical protein